MTTVSDRYRPRKRMVLNMGPHTRTHGVLHVAELDGETVMKADVDIGYLHTRNRENRRGTHLFTGNHDY